LLHLGALVAVGVAGVVGAIIVTPFRMRRMGAFANPWADPQGTGYQIVQSLMAVGSGGAHGVGFAEGRQKMFFLPFAHSDYIFAVVGEELGLVGALTLLAIFGLFLWRGVRAARRAPDRFGMLLGLGIVTSIVAQALFNMSVVLSLLPSKGIPLPFISYGGSSMLLTLAGVGVLLNISQQGTDAHNAELLRLGGALTETRGDAKRETYGGAQIPTPPRHRAPVSQTWRPEGR
jgi:cell division protein FtsW